MLASDPVMSVRVGEIVDIYNTIVEQKEIQWCNSAGQNEDPLSILRK